MFLRCWEFTDVTGLARPVGESEVSVIGPATAEEAEERHGASEERRDPIIVVPGRVGTDHLEAVQTDRGVRLPATQPATRVKVLISEGTVLSWR